MNIYQILCLIGIPSILTSINTWIIFKVKEFNKKNTSLQLGLQALLRTQMINDYNTWIKKGYAPIYVKDNFENCWIQYHSLGANGVMDGIHKDFMELPTSSDDSKL